MQRCTKRLWSCIHYCGFGCTLTLPVLFFDLFFINIESYDHNPVITLHKRIIILFTCRSRWTEVATFGQSPSTLVFYYIVMKQARICRIVNEICLFSFFSFNSQNLTSIGLYCEEIDAKARPQPFIVILWDLLQRTRQFFVLFERRPLPSPSLLKAIDTCFKLHYVFDLNYQADCVASWQFLQNIIFEMNSTASTEISTVKAFRAYYNSLWARFLSKWEKKYRHL